MLIIIGLFKKFRCACGPLAFVIVFLAIARGSHAASTENISLGDAISSALRNNLGVEIDRLTTDIEGARYDAAQGAFDPTFNAEGTYEDKKSPLNQRDFAATGLTSRIFDEKNFLFESSIDGLLPLGTQWSLIAETDRLKNSLNVVQPPSLFFPEYESFLGIRFTQPLLRDFRNNAEVTAMRVAATDKQIADLEWVRRVQTVVSEVIKNYYDLVYARDDEGVKREAIDLARELKEGNEKRLKRGVASPVDVLEAEVAISVREEELISTQHFYNEHQNILAREIFSDFDLVEPTRIRPTGGLESPVPALDRNKFMRSALENRVEYLGVMKQIQKQNIQIKFAENQAWPRVDVVGTIGGSGLAGVSGRSVGNTFDGDGTEWSVGVVLSIPLGNRTAKARLKEQLLERRQLVLGLKRAEMEIALQIDTALSRIKTSQQRLVTSRKSAQLARETLEMENKRLVQGVVGSIEVLEVQRAYAEARSRELAAQADLSKSVIDLWAATGTLLPQFGIILQNTGEYFLGE